ncbi:MAG: hypothetical protein ACRC4K_14750 [Plesiomonas shigelloides]
MVIEKLLAYFGVETDDQSFKAANAELNSLKDSVIGIHGQISAVITAISAGAAMALVTDFTNAADATNKLARRIGTTAETIQEYDYVAQRSGVTTDLMRNSLEKLQGKVSDAAKGNKDMTETLKELGLEAKSFSKMPLGDQMEAIAKGFKGLKTDGDRTRLAMKLFEEEGRGMVTVFEGGSEAIKQMREEARGFGLYSTEDAAAAETFNDNLLDTQMILGSIKTQIGIELMPRLNELLVGFRDWFKEHKKLISSGIVNFFKAAGWALKLLIGGFSILISYRVGALFLGIVRAIKAMTAAMVTARLAAMAMNVQALLIPTLIGAAIAAVIIAIEDIVSYFKGDKSITGLIVNSMKEAWDKVAAYTSQIWDKMIASIKQKLAEIAPQWVIDIVSGVDKTNAASQYQGFGGAANPALAMPMGGGNYWANMPIPQAGATPIRVDVHNPITVNGVTMADIEVKARQQNAQTARDVSKGIIY